MFKRHYPRGQNPIILILGIIVILSILFTMFSQKSQDKLQVYTKSDKVESKDDSQEEEKELDIDTDIYTDNEHHFSLSIPTDWEQVTKNGYPTFVHPASASSLQIQVSNYDPAVNLASADTLSAQVADDGKTFVNFTAKTTSSYELMYQDFQNSTYDYIEEVYWDREQVIKLVCTFNDENYDKIIPYYELILNSFAWNRQYEIPEDYMIYYNQDLNFEVMVPAGWSIGTSGNAISASDPDTGASETVTMTQTETTLDSMTATDMSKLLNIGQSGFMMNSYDNSKESAVARCSYILDNVQHQEVVYAYSTGSMIYFITFDYENGTVDNSLIEKCGKSFRYFEADASENSDNASKNTSESADSTNVENENTTSASDGNSESN